MKQSSLPKRGSLDCFARACHRARVRATRWLAMTERGAWLETQNSPSPNSGKAAKLQIEFRTLLRLDFQVLGSMFAQPLGSPSGNMRNKITKSLILVVPRRAAGDG